MWNRIQVNKLYNSEGIAMALDIVRDTHGWVYQFVEHAVYKWEHVCMFWHTHSHNSVVMSEMRSNLRCFIGNACPH